MGYLFLENRRKNFNLNVVVRLVVVQIVQQHFRVRPLLFYGAGKHILTVALGSSSTTVRITNRLYHSRASFHSRYGSNFINWWTFSDRVHLQHVYKVNSSPRSVLRFTSWIVKALETNVLIWISDDFKQDTVWQEIFSIFTAIRKNKFPQIKITTNIFLAKIYSRVNIL